MLTGTCPECHRVTTLVEGTLPIGTAAPGAGDARAAGDTAASPTPGPECADCGGILTVTARDDGKLQVACAECETTTTFIPEGSESPRRPPERSERYGRPGRREEPEGGAPRSRPCRQCGAPLSFTTDENGNLTGECAACGNRFTLPPRRDGPSNRDRGPGGRYPSRGPPRYGRSPGGWSRGPPRGGRPRYGGSGGGYRRRDSASGREDEDDDRPRRRPRRE